MCRFLLLLFFSVALVPSGFAQRTFPTAATVGVLNGHQYPHVKISGKVYFMAPGAKIFDQANRIILPSMLPEGSAIAYLTDMSGYLSNIWLLTPDEQAALKRTRK